MEFLVEIIKLCFFFVTVFNMFHMWFDFGKTIGNCWWVMKFTKDFEIKFEIAFI